MVPTIITFRTVSCRPGAAGCPKLAEVWEGFDAAAADKDHTLGEPQHISFEGSALKAVLSTCGTAEGLTVRAKAAAKEER